MIRRTTRVLVVEDDPSISRLLQLELAHRGMEVYPVANGRAALKAVASARPDVVILDILLPGLDGEGVLRALRATGSSLPVIMLTARDGVSDKIRNLRTGADDYLTKPFDIDELVARIGTVLRRAAPNEVIRIGDLEVNLTAHAVRRGSTPINLTAREYDLLTFLAINAPRIMSRDVILDRVWNSPDVDPNVVDVYIGYLRRKIDRAGPTPLIRTVRGVGFTLRNE
ncbi:MAG: Two-component transcriptional response regulator, LuxR family [uncultured Thermomicrobiales bacterium]|uniref:Two-component transcriptional response regulator, LuxR family n=1 Tax=uncultured Thermomicrobiales bacterium TaxID=1645740 RepID=A0A6J4V803_9BACT|nr:MAG: Two-component transcriptional response regulator, LuxR family [uncultured Thermomicrobiales bacterium]